MKKRKEKTSSTQNKNNSLSSIQKVVLSFLLNSNVPGNSFWKEYYSYRSIFLRKEKRIQKISNINVTGNSFLSLSLFIQSMRIIVQQIFFGFAKRTEFFFLQLSRKELNIFAIIAKKLIFLLLQKEFYFWFIVIYRKNGKNLLLSPFFFLTKK